MKSKEEQEQEEKDLCNVRKSSFEAYQAHKTAQEYQGKSGEG